MIDLSWIICIVSLAVGSLLLFVWLSKVEDKVYAIVREIKEEKLKEQLKEEIKKEIKENE